MNTANALIISHIPYYIVSIGLIYEAIMIKKILSKIKEKLLKWK